MPTSPKDAHPKENIVDVKSHSEPYGADWVAHGGEYHVAELPINGRDIRFTIRVFEEKLAPDDIALLKSLNRPYVKDRKHIEVLVDETLKNGKTNIIAGYQVTGGMISSTQTDPNVGLGYGDKFSVPAATAGGFAVARAMSDGKMTETEGKQLLAIAEATQVALRARFKDPEFKGVAEENKLDIPLHMAEHKIIHQANSIDPASPVYSANTFKKSDIQR